MKQENYIKGMTMIIMSAFFFACMNVSVRLAGDLPSVQKSFFRNLVAAVFAAIILGKNHIIPGSIRCLTIIPLFIIPRLSKTGFPTCLNISSRALDATSK